MAGGILGLADDELARPLKVRGLQPQSDGRIAQATGEGGGAFGEAFVGSSHSRGGPTGRGVPFFGSGSNSGGGTTKETQQSLSSRLPATVMISC